MTKIDLIVLRLIQFYSKITRFMVDFRITLTLCLGEECKAKTNCALIAQFQTSPTTRKVGAVFLLGVFDRVFLQFPPNRTDMSIYFFSFTIDSQIINFHTSSAIYGRF